MTVSQVDKTMRRIMGLFLFVSLTACSPQAAATPPATLASPVAPTPTAPVSPLALPQSTWAGAITSAEGKTDSILVHLSGTDGTLTIQPKTNTLAISDVQRTDTTLTFKAASEPEMIFAGAWAEGQLTGQVERDGQTSPFILLPLFDAPQSLSGFAGTYQFESGAALTIHLSPSFSASGLDFFWSGLTLTHFGTGAVRGLYPIAPDTFLVGSARVLGYPFAAQIKFTRDATGDVNGLTWEARDPATSALSESQTAMRLELLTETVHYTSADGVTLAGLLTQPSTPGPHPAIVVLHGSERGERDDFFRQQLRTFFASQGIAALTYDKRGVGDSGGTYQESATEANLNRLAQDAVAGVNYLTGRPEIDAQHIGLIGSSQSGWVIPLAAEQSRDVAFFVVLSGPVVSVGIENAYSSYTNNGASSPRYSAQEISAKIAPLPPSGFDPAPVIAKLSQPGLWLWGDQDKSIPIPESVANLEDLIAHGQTQCTYHVFANADHNLQQTTQGLFTEIPYASGYPEDLFSLLTLWLKGQTP